MLKKVIKLSIFIVLLLINATPVSAMCVSTNIQNDINQATAIFAGTVTNIQNNGNTTFAVSQVWKGSVNKTLTISNYNNTAVRGGGMMWIEDMPTFELNKEYLVYLKGSEGNLQTYTCSPTKLLAYAQADLAVLGQGQIIDESNKTLTDYNIPSTNRMGFLGKFNSLQGSLILNAILLVIVILLLIKKKNINNKM